MFNIGNSNHKDYLFIECLEDILNKVEEIIRTSKSYVKNILKYRFIKKIYN